MAGVLSYLKKPAQVLLNQTAVFTSSLHTAPKILITGNLSQESEWINKINEITMWIKGGLGQLGTGLADLFAKTYGNESVVISDISRPSKSFYNKGFN